mgnify:CR=1 FL=1
MSSKALVLSSGGLDSTTCLAMAIDKYGKDNVSTVSIYYGQKHRIELDRAEQISNYYQVKHYELNLSEIFKYNSTCSLLASNSNLEVEKSSYEEQLNNSDGKAIETFVPFRNGLFLSSIASLALSVYPGEEVDIYLGIHSDDSGFAYPDCSSEFNNAMKEAIYLGSGKMIHVVSPLVNLKKKDVVEIGLKLKAPYHLTLSCYDPIGEKSCGKCATCLDRLKAFELNRVKDPIEYV